MGYDQRIIDIAKAAAEGAAAQDAGAEEPGASRSRQPLHHISAADRFQSAQASIHGRRSRLDLKSC